MYGFSRDDVELLAEQGIKPWEPEARAALAVLRGEDDDYDDYEEESIPQSNESPTIQPATSVGAASAALVGGTEAAAEEETDWVMGADGYWWYHDKDTNEWWYKNENGDIVKFS